MRIRNVKPEFYRSDDIDRLTWEQRFFFIALFSYVDDNGVGRDRLPDICADLFAGDFSVEPTETLGRVRDCLAALERAGLIVRYTIEGKAYLFITGWDKHQYVKNPNKERFPRPGKALLQASPDSTETLGRDSVGVTPDVPPVVGSRSLVVGRRSQEAPPTPEQNLGQAAKITSTWMQSCETKPPKGIIGKVRTEVQQLLDEGFDPDLIARGVAKWQDRGKFGPGMIPNMVHEVANPKKLAEQPASELVLNEHAPDPGEPTW